MAASLDQRSSKRGENTCLHLASSVEKLRFLLERAMDVQVRSSLRGTTPLIHWASLGRLDLVRVLATAPGSDVTTRDKFGEDTAFDEAQNRDLAEQHREAVIDFFLSTLPKPDSRRRRSAVASLDLSTIHSLVHKWNILFVSPTTESPPNATNTWLSEDGSCGYSAPAV